MFKTHKVDHVPLINAEIVNQDVDAATFVLARTNTTLEESDHAQILLRVSLMLNLSDHFEALALVNPFFGLNFSYKTKLLGSRNQSLIDHCLEFFCIFDESILNQIAMKLCCRELIKLLLLSVCLAFFLILII